VGQSSELQGEEVTRGMVIDTGDLNSCCLECISTHTLLDAVNRLVLVCQHEQGNARVFRQLEAALDCLESERPTVLHLVDAERRKHDPEAAVNAASAKALVAATTRPRSACTVVPSPKAVMASNSASPSSSSQRSPTASEVGHRHDDKRDGQRGQQGGHRGT
jgi:hypothetical protein